MEKIKDSLTYTDEFIEQAASLYAELQKRKKSDLQFTRFDNFLAFRYSVFKTQHPGFKHMLG